MANYRPKHPYLAIWGGILLIPVLGLVITGMLLLALYGAGAATGGEGGGLGLLVFIVILGLEIAGATYLLRKWAAS